MTAYEGQIKVWSTEDKQYKFVSVKTSHNKDPYRYATRSAAEHMLRVCYPGLTLEDKQVIEVDAEPNIHIQGW